jgi:hypothetical protein
MIYNLGLSLQFHAAIKKIQEFRGKTIELKEYKPKRTNLQNRYYWSILKAIEDETGNDKDILHEFFKQKYLNFQIIELFDEKLFHTPSTTILDTKQFTDYIEKVRIFALTEVKMQRIPRPEDQDFEQFLNHYEKMI